ncbi:Uncharacterized protein Fot_04897 [Forsythia ovata]|uniref:Uncharacterized protein n=1 Tax=Forsythia ovata TaxID=205694 RepID=A0ABD1WNL2_9LAMI
MDTPRLTKLKTVSPGEETIPESNTSSYQRITFITPKNSPNTKETTKIKTCKTDIGCFHYESEAFSIAFLMLGNYDVENGDCDLRMVVSRLVNGEVGDGGGDSNSSIWSAAAEAVS